MEDMLREILKNELRERKLVVLSEDTMCMLVDEAFNVADTQDLASTLDYITDTVLDVYSDSLIPLAELGVNSDDRDLTRLSAADYYRDYRLYLEHCDIAEQRNLTTYFAEFEHQEGNLYVSTKNVVALIVVQDLLQPLRVKLRELEANMFKMLKQGVKHNNKGEVPSHEELVEYVQSHINAIERAIKEEAAHVAE